MRALRIPVSGPIELAVLSGRLEDVQALVGGTIEALDLNDRAVLYVDEEAKIKDLPVNPRLTRLCQEIYRIGMLPDDTVNGPGVVLGPTNANGNWTSLVLQAAQEICTGLGEPLAGLTQQWRPGDGHDRLN